MPKLEQLTRTRRIQPREEVLGTFPERAPRTQAPGDDAEADDLIEQIDSLLEDHRARCLARAAGIETA